MGKFQGVRRISLTVSFSLIITFTLLIHADFAGAGRIGPNQGFDTITLLRKQEHQLHTTQSTAFGIHGLRVISLQNKALTALLQPSPPSFGTPGFWILMVHSYESNSFHSDYAFGLTSNNTSYPAIVDLNPGIGFAIAIGIVYLSSPSAEDPFKFFIEIQSTPND